MNHKIKIMHKKHAASISDEEIRGLMDFEGLVMQADRLTFWAKMLGSIKLLTGGLVAISLSVFLFWITPDDRVAPPEFPTPSEQTPLPSAAESTAVGDSVAARKEVAVQRLPSINVQPKKKAVIAREDRAVEEPARPATKTAADYHEAEPIQGFPNLYGYFSAELKYPEEAVQDSIEGVVTVAFIINREGRVGTITILKSLGPAFDAEAIRLVNNMPAWKAATIDGKPVPSRFSLPLNFQFDRAKK